ncbi:hypothetical protein D3P07_23180 [Paenibacillus sp. 1011MAR3C5]|uniref:hypothetical protein n=1 Tax=Paenibacillus sp. 1011MAR3C5 TaxID=1675787 RepID=UPI000E6CE693|nr:hypothetical protein [Paenibacillus sp. 1011MAR3C5]RJE84274.1 hypothetical protein D3P07_23180 [Paenibacillus sp. 1011MAR3C5]
MSTTKALARGQKHMLGVVRGMMGSMNLAALAVDNMQRSMVIAERKAAERMQSSLGAMERAVTAMVTPLDEAAKGITALAEAIEAAGKRMISVSQPMVTAGISTAIQLPSVVPSEPPAQEAKAVSLESERAKLEEKIKKEVIPKFGEFIEMIGSNIPDINTITETEKKKTEEKKKQETEMSSSKQIEAMLSSQAVVFEEMSTKLSGLAVLNTSIATKLGEWLDSMHKTIQSGLSKANDSLSGILTKISSIVSSIAQVSSGRGSEVIEALPYGGSSNLLPVPYEKPENSIVLAKKATSDLQTTNAMAAANIIEHSPSNTLALPAPAAEAAEAAAAEATPAVESQIPKITESVALLKESLTSLMTENAAVAGFMADNWSTVGPIYEGVNKAVSVYNTLQQLSQVYTALTNIAMGIHKTITEGVGKAWNGLNTAMKANVIFLIISLVAGLVMMLINLWKTNDTVALFMLKVWNKILNFWDQLVIFFWTLVDALSEPFLMFAKTIGKIIDGVVNGIIDEINGFLDVVNSVFGTSYQISFKADMESFVQDLVDKAPDEKQKAIARAEFNKQQRIEEENNFLAERAAQRAEQEIAAEEKAVTPYEDPSTQFQQNAAVSVGGGRLDEVGKINDTVDISSEDLKTMRELAEMKNIQNFVTLQPSVNVQTGDIKNGMDVSSMVQAITTVLQEEISVSAEGVYR